MSIIRNNSHEIEINLKNNKNGEMIWSKIFSSDYKIHKVLDFEKIGRIVILFYGYPYPTSENVICINYKGEIVWTVPLFKYMKEISPFVDITEIDPLLVQAYNGDSSYWVIKPQTGEVVINPDESMKGRKPW
jgi:hypothetical protein